MAGSVVVKPAEMLVLKCKLPCAWGARMRIAAQIMRFAGLVAGVAVEIEVADKQ